MTSDRPSDGLCAADYKTLSQAFNPPHCFSGVVFICLLQNCYGRSKALLKFTTSLLSIYRSMYLIIQGYQAGQAISLL